MRQHLSILAVLHAILSAFGLLAAIATLAATLGVGAFLSFSNAANAPMGTGLLVGTIGTIVSVVIAVIALPGMALAYGLWKRRPWARLLGIVLGAINLFHFPFGTLVGAYTLWAMFQPETREILEGEQQSMYA